MTDLLAGRTLNLGTLTAVPFLTTEGYVVLVDALLEVAPEQPPDFIEMAKKQLGASRDRAKAALVARLGSDVNAALEQSFDNLVDRLWTSGRAFLEFWLLYLHEGIKLLDGDEQQAIDLETGRQLAEIADGLLDRLFGASKAEFLRRPYPEQLAQMESRLAYIEEAELDAVFEQLVGKPLATLLRVCQGRYAAMVKDRSLRERAVSPDLRDVRAELRQNIGLYNGLVAGLLMSDDPEAPARVKRALMPNVLAQRPRDRGAAASEDEADDEVELPEAGANEDAPAAE